MTKKAKEKQTIEKPEKESLETEAKEVASEEKVQLSEVETLKKELEVKQKESAELYDRLLRVQADTDNFRKRLQKEQADIVRYATEGLVNNLLPVIDDFERAIESADNTKDFDALVNGVKMIFDQLKSVLQKAGLTDVPASGQPFDPTHHEAVRVMESDEHQEDTVVEELRKGYLLNGRVLRPSMVTVAKKKG